jgi:hypothetical protein
MVSLNISFSPAHYIFLEITFHPGHSYTENSEKKGKSLAWECSNEDANQDVNQGLFKEATRKLYPDRRRRR